MEIRSCYCSKNKLSATTTKPTIQANLQERREDDRKSHGKQPGRSHAGRVNARDVRIQLTFLVSILSLDAERNNGQAHHQSTKADEGEKEGLGVLDEGLVAVTHGPRGAREGEQDLQPEEHEADHLERAPDVAHVLRGHEDAGGVLPAPGGDGALPVAEAGAVVLASPPDRRPRPGLASGPQGAVAARPGGHRVDEVAGPGLGRVDRLYRRVPVVLQEEAGGLALPVRVEADHAVQGAEGFGGEDGGHRGVVERVGLFDGLDEDADGGGAGGGVVGRGPRRRGLEALRELRRAPTHDLVVDDLCGERRARRGELSALAPKGTRVAHAEVPLTKEGSQGEIPIMYCASVPTLSTKESMPTHTVKTCARGDQPARRSAAIHSVQPASYTQVTTTSGSAPGAE